MAAVNKQLRLEFFLERVQEVLVLRRLHLLNKPLLGSVLRVLKFYEVRVPPWFCEERKTVNLVPLGIVN